MENLVFGAICVFIFIFLMFGWRVVEELKDVNKKLDVLVGVNEQ